MVDFIDRTFCLISRHLNTFLFNFLKRTKVTKKGIDYFFDVLESLCKKIYLKTRKYLHFHESTD